MAVPSKSKQKISVVVPIYNENKNIPLLFEKVARTFKSYKHNYELILVNDGSSDGSTEILDRLAAKQRTVKVIHFRRNYGQTAAMQAGFDAASGDIIIPMDGDLQNDPDDIPRLVAKLDEGYDVVSGWRKDRKDHAIKRNLVSRLANRLISRISGVKLHDFGCSLKAYRRDVLKDVRLYGEMHRFVPIYASWQGGRVTELPVKHYPRIHGQSKYGLERIVKVLLDLIVVKFLHEYSHKPIYIFGGFGILSLVISFFSLAWMLVLKLYWGKSFVETPVPLIVIFSFLTGILSILLGLIAELITRTYYESQGKKTYEVSFAKPKKK